MCRGPHMSLFLEKGLLGKRWSRIIYFQYLILPLWTMGSWYETKRWLSHSWEKHFRHKETHLTIAIDQERQGLQLQYTVRYLLLFRAQVFLLKSSRAAPWALSQSFNLAQVFHFVSINQPPWWSVLEQTGTFFLLPAAVQALTPTSHRRAGPWKKLLLFSF